MDVKFFGEGGGGFAMGLRKFRDWFLKTNETTQISINNSLIFLVDNGKRSGMDMEILRCVLALKRN